MHPNVVAALRLMLVTDDALLGNRDPVAVCQAAVRGGVTSVQLRLKLMGPGELTVLARRLVESLNVPVLVNDRADVAIAARAAGVHLGPDDLPVRLVRRIAPAGFLIGASVASAAEAELGQEAAYWGVGPWRTTGTKPDAGPPLGSEGLARIVSQGKGRPCLAIGGVRVSDVFEIRRSGATGIAVISGILAAPDLEAAARHYRIALDSVLR
jgi:thiamine-phosphate pyrophosphorylase